MLIPTILCLQLMIVISMAVLVSHLISENWLMVRVISLLHLRSLSHPFVIYLLKTYIILQKLKIPHILMIVLILWILKMLTLSFMKWKLTRLMSGQEERKTWYVNAMVWLKPLVLLSVLDSADGLWIIYLQLFSLEKGPPVYTISLIGFSVMKYFGIFFPAGYVCLDLFVDHGYTNECSGV